MNPRPSITSRAREDLEGQGKPQPSLQTPRSFGRTQSGPAAIGGDVSTGKSSCSVATSMTSKTSLSGLNSKRRADAAVGDVNKKKKKTKVVPDPIKILTTSSFSRQRQVTEIDASASAGPSDTMRPPRIRTSTAAIVVSNNFLRSYDSKSTGLSETSAIFSTGSDASAGTQDTIEASSQEQRRPAPGHGLALCSQDSYGLTSSLEEGIRESFDRIPQLNVEPVPTLMSGNTVGSSHSAELNPLPSNNVDAQVPRRTSDWEIQAQAQDSSLFSAVWPLHPVWLRGAPFPVTWEAIRIAQSCGIDLTTIDLEYNPEWTRQRALRASLCQHPAFRGKAFPAASSDVAWAAGLRAAGHDQSSILPADQQVVYTASLEFSRRSTSLEITLQPLKLELSHRLGRHYGADRFVEMLVPSPGSSSLPFLKNDTSFFEHLIRWLGKEHAFGGRSWKAFYTKSGGSRKPAKDLQFGPEPKPIFTDRIFFLAERAVAEPAMRRVRLSSMLNWALDLRQKDNGSQPVLKLFQRIALVLSRTSPTVVFESHQITHRGEDICSRTTGKIMNDGVARMSPAVARHIRACLGLTITPSAIQGRLGSAKGMWILDTTISPSSDQMWIETFPSQRKWVMDWASADKHHRTLEIRDFASMPKSASFNLQFLPVIEDRAVDKAFMRKAIGGLLTTNLRNELDGQKRALQTPLQFRQWNHENSTHKHDRIVHGRVPFLGGLPQEDEEVMNMMLDAGFDSSNELLNGITWNIQKRKCEMLKKKLNIKVGRSVYLYMVVDFLGILEENEVHVGFSTAFEADEEWSKTMLHGVDVLVARSPAHFVSDIQKVKAVFRPELADLTDVIVFSTKGNIPLADKLSGGDYDGDRAWVCWDPRIVDNFANAPVQDQPDLSSYMTKDTETFRDLLKKQNKSLSSGVRAMLNLAFEFNLDKSMLGGCTKYKERICYARNSVSDKPAKFLSTLLSNLVDQPKQGLRFNSSDFQRMLKDLGLPAHVNDPIYTLDHWPSKAEKVHIIDYLKFSVAKPTIARELESFHKAIKSSGSYHWDEDLALRYKEFTGQARTSESATKLLLQLKADIKAVQAEWDAHNSHVDDSVSFAERVAHVYVLWQGIEPREHASGSSSESQVVHSSLCEGGELSDWELLKASTAFWMYCNSSGSSPRFVWQMASTQLCWIKALAVAKKTSQGAVGAPRPVIPSIYASLRPDAKYVKQVTARMEGGSQFELDSDDDDE